MKRLLLGLVAALMLLPASADAAQMAYRSDGSWLHTRAYHLSDGTDWLTYATAINEANNLDYYTHWCANTAWDGQMPNVSITDLGGAQMMSAQIRIWDDNFPNVSWDGLTEDWNNGAFSTIKLNRDHLTNPGWAYPSTNSTWNNSHEWWLMAVPCHELGHALGLAHFPDGVMAAGYWWDKWQPWPNGNELYAVNLWYPAYDPGL